MRMRILRSYIVVLIAAFFVSCASFPEENERTQSSNLTAGMVKTKIIKGETTQAEILKVFGAPNIITKNRSNDEVWNFNKMSFINIQGTDLGVLIFWPGSRAITTATTKSFDLIIIFDEKDIVKDYSIISASY